MDIYEYEQVNESLWVIGERMSGKKGSVRGALWIYLVVGQTRAAVIDSGMGITKDLRRVCETITDKPLTCYVTHGHPDHAGGACLFDEIYMSPKDEVDFPWALPAKRRLGDLEHFAQNNQELKEYCRRNMILDASFVYKPLYHGDQIDLGNVELEVISVPGHTPGSMCFLNRKEKYICVGDAISEKQMFGASSTSVAVYLDSLKRLQQLIPEGTKFFGGHYGVARDSNLIAGMMEACEEVIAGFVGNDIPHVPIFKEQVEEYKTRKMMVHTASSHGAKLVYNVNMIV